MSLTGIVTVHNCLEIVYPIFSCLQSLLPVCDKVLVVNCGSSDQTIDAIYSSKEPKIKILEGHWSDRAEVLSEMVNMARSKVKTEWFIHLDADEVLHESSYQSLNEIQCSPFFNRINAAAYKTVHFRGDFHTEFDFIYAKHIRIARTDSDWISWGDACDLASPSGDKKLWFLHECRVFHYGKVHVGRRLEALQKEMDFQMMFRHLNIPGIPDPLVMQALADGEIDYHKILERFPGRPFTGDHPRAAQSWIERMEAHDRLVHGPE